MIYYCITIFFCKLSIIKFDYLTSLWYNGKIKTTGVIYTMTIEKIFETLNFLTPVDLSLVMLVVSLVDLWAAIGLTIKNRSLISKTLISGFVNNLMIIMLPFGLKALTLTRAEWMGSAPSIDYVQFLSILITILYLTTTVTSIIANYSAAYPESKNWLTRFAYKYLPKEVEVKQDKHGIKHD